MSTTAADDVREGMQVRVTVTSKPNGALIEGRMVWAGEVTGLQGDSSGAIWAHLDGDTTFGVPLTSDEFCDVEVRVGEWPEGTLAKADVIVDRTVAIAEGDEHPEDRLGVIVIREGVGGASGWRIVEDRWASTLYDHGDYLMVTNIRKITVPA